MAQDTLARALAIAAQGGGGGGGTSDYNKLKNKPVAGNGIDISATTVPVISAKIDGETIKYNLDGELESESPIKVTEEIIHHPAAPIVLNIPRNGAPGSDYDLYDLDTAAYLYNYFQTGVQYPVTFTYTMDDGWEDPELSNSFLYFNNKWSSSLGESEYALRVTDGLGEHYEEFYLRIDNGRIHVYWSDLFGTLNHVNTLHLNTGVIKPAWDERVVTVLGAENISDNTTINVDQNGILTGTKISWPTIMTHDWFSTDYTHGLVQEDASEGYAKFTLTNAVNKDKLWAIANELKSLKQLSINGSVWVPFSYADYEGDTYGTSLEIPDPKITDSFSNGVETIEFGSSNHCLFHIELNHNTKQISAYVETWRNWGSDTRLLMIRLEDNEKLYTQVPGSAIPVNSNVTLDNHRANNTIAKSDSGISIESSYPILKNLDVDRGLTIDYGGEWDPQTYLYSKAKISPEIPLYSEKEFTRDTTYEWSETYTGFPVKSEASYYDNRDLTDNEFNTLMSHLPNTQSLDQNNPDPDLWRTLVHFVATFTDSTVLEFDAVPICQPDYSSKVFKIYRPEYNYQGVNTGIEFCVSDPGEGGNKFLSFESNYAYDNNVSLASLVIAIPKLDTFTVDLTNAFYDGSAVYVNDPQEAKRLNDWLDLPRYYGTQNTCWPANYYIVEATYTNGNREAFTRYNYVQEDSNVFLWLSYNQSPWIAVYDSNDGFTGNTDPYFMFEASTSQIKTERSQSASGETLASLTIKRPKGTFQYNYHQLPAEYIPIDNESIKVDNGVLTIPALPAAPSVDGEYDLHCSVSSGTVTYSWVART